MENYRCSAGHVSSLDFGESLKMNCPACEAAVYRYRDVVKGNAAATVVDDHVTTVKRGSLKLPNGALVVGLLGLVAIGAGFFMNKSALERAKDAGSGHAVPYVTDVKPAAPMRLNNLADITITEFKASETPAGSVQTSFVLTNTTGKDNDFPSLVVEWKGSASGATVINNRSYAHPAGKFTRVAVETELAKPADATGLEIKLTY